MSWLVYYYKSRIANPRHRVKDLEQLEESKKQTLYDLIDTYIRDCKTRKAYS